MLGRVSAVRRIHHLRRMRRPRTDTKRTETNAHQAIARSREAGPGDPRVAATASLRRQPTSVPLRDVAGAGCPGDRVHPAPRCAGSRGRRMYRHRRSFRDGSERGRLACARRPRSGDFPAAASAATNTVDPRSLITHTKGTTRCHLTSTGCSMRRSSLSSAAGPIATAASHHGLDPPPASGGSGVALKGEIRWTIPPLPASRCG
jgi:hypothetical protein